MLKNFIRMPKALKWLTSYGLATAIFPVLLLIPDNRAGSFGVAEGWSGGARWIAACSVLPMPVSAVLMLRRLRSGRWLYVLGWIAANVSPALVALSRGAPTHIPLPSVAFTLPVLAAFSFYLFMSKEVREYFQGPEATPQRMDVQ